MEEVKDSEKRNRADSSDQERDEKDIKKTASPEKIAEVLTVDVDRTKVCPFLLRCFWKLNQHNVPSDYRFVSRGIYPNQEVQIYTWLNATLGEIAELLRDVIPAAQEKHASLHFNIVYVDQNGFFAFRRAGQVSLARPGTDNEKTLKSCNFEIGEFFDISISQPNASGSNTNGGRIGQRMANNKQPQSNANNNDGSHGGSNKRPKLTHGRQVFR